MRVFLDTNVLVSAFVSRGLCADILRVVLEKHDLLVSQLVLQELDRVLRDKLNAPKPLVEQALTVFDHVQVVPSPAAVRSDLGFDEDDAAIVMAAINAGADVFVTGDSEILAAAGKSPLLMVSPRRFMELLRSSDGSYPDPDGRGDEPRVSDRLPTTAREMAFGIALEIVTLCRTLEDRREAVLAGELLRAGTAIGAALEEANAATTPRQAVPGIALALQKARATDYWLRLLEASGVMPKTDLEPHQAKCNELIHQLRAIEASLSAGYV